MKLHNTIWTVLIALGWIAVAVSAVATDGFQNQPHFPSWVRWHADAIEAHTSQQQLAVRVDEGGG